VLGKSWATLGRLLDPITQDACAFCEAHGLFSDFTGMVYAKADLHVAFFEGHA